MKGCLKEIRRLKLHYRKEYKKTGHWYDIGIADGLDMAIDIIENKKEYGD